jgi:hypothetical protein
VVDQVASVFERVFQFEFDWLQAKALNDFPV